MKLNRCASMRAFPTTEDTTDGRVPLTCPIPRILCLQVIAAIGIVLGLFALVVPYIGAMGSCGPFMDSACGDRCPGYECSAEVEEAS